MLHELRGMRHSTEPDECSMRFGERLFCALWDWNRSSLLDWAETYAKYLLRYLWQIGGKKGIHQCATPLSMRVVNPLRRSQQKTSKDLIDERVPFRPHFESGQKRALDCSLSFSSCLCVEKEFHVDRDSFTKKAATQSGKKYPKSLINNFIKLFRLEATFFSLLLLVPAFSSIHRNSFFLGPGEWSE